MPITCWLAESSGAKPPIQMRAWEFVEALASPDPELRQFARDMLIQRRDNAIALLEDAVGAGVLTPEVAGRWMVELLRAGRPGTSDFLVTSEA
jgi:hypothetical protein